MGVVAAGVHDAGMQGSKFRPRFFLYRQGVGVAPDAHHGPGQRALHLRHRDMRVRRGIGNAPPIQRFAQKGVGFRFLISHFRNLVQTAVQPHRFVLHGQRGLIPNVFHLTSSL
jgi:hypothetical protein